MIVLPTKKFTFVCNRLRELVHAPMGSKNTIFTQPVRHTYAHSLQMVLVLQHRKNRLPDFLATLASHSPVALGGEEDIAADATRILDAMQCLLLYWYVFT